MCVCLSATGAAEAGASEAGLTDAAVAADAVDTVGVLVTVAVVVRALVDICTLTGR